MEGRQRTASETERGDRSGKEKQTDGQTKGRRREISIGYSIALVP